MATQAAGPDRTEGRLAVRGPERHAAIHDLLAQGKNYIQISQMLGLTRHTVRQFARAATPGQMIVGPRPRSSGQDHFAAGLQQRWNPGCTDRPGNHPVDHQCTIRRIKALARQMSGRANLDLLRKRILLST